MIDNVRVKTTVHRNVYEAASMKAALSGTTVAALMRDALIAYAGDVPPPEVPEPVWISTEAWAHFRAWVADGHSNVVRHYKGDRDWSVPENRSAVVQWASEHGYTPDPG